MVLGRYIPYKKSFDYDFYRNNCSCIRYNSYKLSSMEKEFVPYTEALALKELGFDEPCVFLYYNYGSNYVIAEPLIKNSNLSGNEEITAPIYSQAFRWFREKYKLQQIIWSGKISTVFYGYDILNIDEQEFIINNFENGGGDCDYGTYEEAELACLKKLIEIVKEK